MDYRILGPLEVSEGERTVELGGDKQRALLAILLLHANEVVSADRLIDWLWEEQPPPLALKKTPFDCEPDMKKGMSSTVVAIVAPALPTFSPRRITRLRLGSTASMDRPGTWAAKSV